jgi:hypothetical protein
MKKTILFLLIVSCASVLQAQQTFQMTMKSVGNTVSIYVKPNATDCKFFGELEFYIRYPNTQNLTFSNFQTFGFFSNYNYSLNNFTPTIREGGNYSIRIGFPVLLNVCSNTIYNAGEEYKVCSFQVAGTGVGGGSTAMLQLVHEATTKSPYVLKLTDGANSLLSTNLGSYFYPNTSNSTVAGKNYYYYELNNIALPAAQPCPKLIPVTITNTRPTSARITWNAVIGESYKLSYRVIGSNETWQTMTKVSTNTTEFFYVIGLKSNEKYECELHSSCSFNNPLIGMQNQFKTVDCMSLKTLQAMASNITAVSAKIGGPTLNGETYLLQYRPKGTQVWTMVTRTAMTVPLSIDIAFLIPATTYEYAYRPSCSIFYDFLQEFTTQAGVACAAPTTPLQIIYNADGLSFSAAYLIGEYEIQYCAKGTQNWVTRAFAPNSIRQLTGLSPKTVFDYRIRLKCGPNGFSPYSAILHKKPF